jgi:hypothetical protein
MPRVSDWANQRTVPVVGPSAAAESHPFAVMADADPTGQIRRSLPVPVTRWFSSMFSPRAVASAAVHSAWRRMWPRRRG